MFKRKFTILLSLISNAIRSHLKQGLGRFLRRSFTITFSNYHLQVLICNLRFYHPESNFSMSQFDQFEFWPLFDQRLPHRFRNAKFEFVNSNCKIPVQPPVSWFSFNSQTLNSHQIATQHPYLLILKQSQTTSRHDFN